MTVVLLPPTLRSKRYRFNFKTIFNRTRYLNCFSSLIFGISHKKFTRLETVFLSSHQLDMSWEWHRTFKVKRKFLLNISKWYSTVSLCVCVCSTTPNKLSNIHVLQLILRPIQITHHKQTATRNVIDKNIKSRTKKKCSIPKILYISCPQYHFCLPCVCECVCLLYPFISRKKNGIFFLDIFPHWR